MTSHHAVSFVPSDIVHSDRLVVFASDEDAMLALLSSSIHEVWVHRPGSTTHETRLTYFPSDGFETYPFPSNLSRLGDPGADYDVYRRALMLRRDEGLTQTYNRFHDSSESSEDIQRLRKLHVSIDHAVMGAYGWDGLELDHGFHETKQGKRFTVSESARREIVNHLLRLNHEQYEEEVRLGLHKKKSKGKKGPASEAEEADEPSLF